MSVHRRAARAGSLLFACLLSVAPLASADPPVAASDADLSRDDEIADLKRQLATVVDEVEKLRAQVAAPETPTELEPKNGFGPAAAKVYSIARGLSLGGYVEGHYSYQDMGNAPSNNEVNLDREVLYLGYKFNDWLAWNSEIEFENASTEENGSVTVEFSTLDFMFTPEFNARVGVLLLPMGIINEVHEPPFYYSVFKPQVETSIIPTTWSDYGVGFYGRIGETLSYRVYLVDGLNAQGFDSSGIREGRQGSSEALAQDLAIVGRLEWEPLPGLSLGDLVLQRKLGTEAEARRLGHGVRHAQGERLHLGAPLDLPLAGSDHARPLRAGAHRERRRSLGAVQRRGRRSTGDLAAPARRLRRGRV